MTANRRGAEKRLCVEALRDTAPRRAFLGLRQCPIGFRPPGGRRRARARQCRHAASDAKPKRMASGPRNGVTNRPTSRSNRHEASRAHPAVRDHARVRLAFTARVSRRARRRLAGDRGPGVGRQRGDHGQPGREAAANSSETPATRPARSAIRWPRCPATTTSTSSARTSPIPPSMRTGCGPGPGRCSSMANARSRAGSPWRICSRPHPLEERVYRLRCVEAWSMVIPWIGFPLGDLVTPLQANLAREVRRVHDPARSEADAGTALPGSGLALRRRPAHRRGGASTRDPRRRPLRQAAAKPERGAAPPCRALEVRIQEHQVDRPHPFRRARCRRRPGLCPRQTSTASSPT